MDAVHKLKEAYHEARKTGVPIAGLHISYDFLMRLRAAKNHYEVIDTDIQAGREKVLGFTPTTYLEGDNDFWFEAENGKDVREVTVMSLPLWHSEHPVNQTAHGSADPKP